MSPEFLFRCNIPVSQKKSSGSKCYVFPTSPPWLYFPAKIPLVVPHCPWSIVTISSIKAPKVFNILGANKNYTLPHPKLDTATLTSRHRSSSPLLNTARALLPRAYITSPAENVLLALPWQKSLLLPQGVQFKYFHPTPTLCSFPILQLRCTRAELCLAICYNAGSLKSEFWCPTRLFLRNGIV